MNGDSQLLFMIKQPPADLKGIPTFPTTTTYFWAWHSWMEEMDKLLVESCLECRRGRPPPSELWPSLMALIRRFLKNLNYLCSERGDGRMEVQPEPSIHLTYFAIFTGRKQMAWRRWRRRLFLCDWILRSGCRNSNNISSLSAGCIPWNMSKSPSRCPRFL